MVDNEFIQNIVSKTEFLISSGINLTEKIVSENISSVISSELSLLKDGDLIKVMDSNSEFGEENGVYIQIIPTLSLSIVQNMIQTKKDIILEDALELLAMAYAVRIISSSQDNIKDYVIDITKKINTLLNKTRTEG